MTASKQFDVSLLLTGRRKKYISERIGAQCIDVVVVFMAVAVLASVVGDIVGWFAVPALVVYFTVLETVTGHTVGKHALALQVVGKTGDKPTVFESVIRNIIRPFEAFGIIAVIVVGATAKGQRIGDLAAGTFVVHRDELESCAQQRQALVENSLSNSREVIPLSSTALPVVQKGIAESLNPIETGLVVSPPTLPDDKPVVQYDIVEIDDGKLFWTAGGVTVSVHKEIAEKCEGLQIDVADGKLVTTSAQ